MNDYDVWVRSWATDYDGQDCVALVFSTRELAIEAGIENPQRCTIITELPEPMRWVARSVLFTDGVQGEITARPENYYFDHDAIQAWRGTNRTDEGVHPFRRWIRVDSWTPDTPEAHAEFDALVAKVNANPDIVVNGYEKWTVDSPHANTYDAVSDYSGHAH
jgi:hypothetical protein